MGCTMLLTAAKAQLMKYEDMPPRHRVTSCQDSLDAGSCLALPQCLPHVPHFGLRMHGCGCLKKSHGRGGREVLGRRREVDRKGRNQVLSDCSSRKFLRARRKLVPIAAAEIREIIDKIDRVQRGD